MNPTTQADAFARVLAQKNVDPNEVAKSFTHLRTFLRRADHDANQTRQQAAQEWWNWLGTLTGSSAYAVLRSGRTQGYYENIRDAANSYLQGLEPDHLEQALGWGVRMMRYYRNVPDAIRKPSPFGKATPVKPGAQFQPSEPEPAAQAPKATKRTQPAKPAAPTLPEVGQIFTNTILDTDETAVLVQIKGFEPKEAVGLIPADKFAGRTFHEGNLARVEVLALRTLKSGRILVELKPAKRKNRN